MDSLVQWFASTLGQYVSDKIVVFIVSLLPLLECRGGLLVSSLLKVDIRIAIPICVIGNLLPIPFILLFIKKIFQWLKRFSFTRKIIEKLEKRAMNKKSALDKGEFIGLLLFVGIPLPGTGAWTGALIASLLNIDVKKATIAIFFGVLLATIIMSIVSYGLLAAIVA